MSPILNSIRAEYERYHALAERALAQVPDAMLSAPGPSGGNSLTVTDGGQFAGGHWPQFMVGPCKRTPTS